MAAKKSINPAEMERAGILFSTIAHRIEDIDQLCLEAISMVGDPNENAWAMISAARALCCQVGLLADMGAASMGSESVTAREGDPAKWLLPPSYHAAAEKTEARHG